MSFCPHSLGSEGGNFLQTPSVLPLGTKSVSGVPPTFVRGIFLLTFLCNNHADCLFQSSVALLFFVFISFFLPCIVELHGAT